MAAAPAQPKVSADSVGDPDQAAHEPKKGDGGCCGDDGCRAPTSVSAVAVSMPGVLNRGAEALSAGLVDVAPWICLSIVATAASNTWQPDGGWTESFKGSDTIANRAAILAVSLPVQMCEHAVVNIAVRTSLHCAAAMSPPGSRIFYSLRVACVVCASADHGARSHQRLRSLF